MPLEVKGLKFWKGEPQSRVLTLLLPLPCGMFIDLGHRQEADNSGFESVGGGQKN